MNDRATYAAVCERSGRWWAVHVPDVPGVYTQATRLDSAADQARDAIAAFLDVSPDSFDVDIREHLSPTAEHDRLELEVARSVIRAAEAHLRAATRTLAHRLVREDGLSMRDAALIIGVSHQRVAQLLDEYRAVELAAGGLDQVYQSLLRVDRHANVSPAA